MPRRWRANERYHVSGVDLRISRGKKAPDDLRVDVWDGDTWIPVGMDLVFFLVDFFAENEDYLRNYRSHWKQNGQRYFLSQCISAVRNGWRVPSALIRRQRNDAA